jgi:cytidylate kinase
MPVITVSGSLGSGAREIAQAIAVHLKLDYVDREILVEAARHLGVSISAVESHDERPSRLGERLGSIMLSLMERSAIAGTVDPLAGGGGGGLDMILARTYGEAAGLPSDAPRGQLDDESYLNTLTTVIKGVAARGNVVILGRGGQAILRDAPETVHVYVAASKEHRIGNLMWRDGETRADAERRIKQSDENRRQFHRRFFKVEAEDARLYDLSINAARVSQNLAVRLIVDVVAERVPKPG